MGAFDFVKNNVSVLDEKALQTEKEILIGEYIPVAFLKKEEISRDVFCEKVYDFFKDVEAKNVEYFHNLTDRYVKLWDSIVEDRIAKAQKADKKDSSPIVPRARKYYEKAINEYKTEEDIFDFSRIMMCLYTEIIKNEYKEISDFEYSDDVLNLETMIAAMKEEKNRNKNRFNLEDKYKYDNCIFAMSIILFFAIKSRGTAEVEK